MIAGINDNCVNGCGGNKRVVSDYCPGSHVAAAIGRFPNAATNRSGVGNDAAIHGRGWIDSNGVNSAFSGRVIIAARAAGHALWLGTEGGKSACTKRRRIARTTLLVGSSGDPARDPSVLSSGDTHPCGIKPARGIGQTISPIQFQLRKTSSFVL